MISLGNAYIYHEKPEMVAELLGESSLSRSFSFDSLGVDEARVINKELFLRGAFGGGVWVTVVAKNVTEEAQNALLKSLEELRPDRGIIFVLPRSLKLLGTFSSRIININKEVTARHYLSGEAMSFLGMSVSDRITYVRANDNPDLIDALEERCYENVMVGTHNILFVKQLFRGGGISAKMALEHLSYLLPSA